MKWKGLVLAVLIAVAFSRTAWAQKDGPVTIFVADAAQDVIQELAKQFQKDTKVVVKVTGGPTQTLVPQITNGAQVDLFLSASPEWAELLKENEMTVKIAPLLGNKLVLIVPKNNPAGVTAPEDFSGSGVKKVALSGEKSPAAVYAEKALQDLEVYDALVTEKKIVRGKDVKGVIGMVEHGEVDAAIVFATAVRGAKNVEVVYTFDPEKHEKIVFPLVLMRRGAKNGNAQKFFDYLLSKDVNDNYEQHGFTRLEE